MPRIEYKTLDELKAAIKKHREDAVKLESHFNRLNREYNDWEDRTAAIEEAVYQFETETGIAKDELLKPQEEELDAFDILNEATKCK